MTTSYRIIRRFGEGVLKSGFPTLKSAQNYVEDHYMGHHWTSENLIPLGIVEEDEFVKPYRDEMGNYVD